ncbi:unnamed protein product [Amoebophrya sp. A120]|nr:unnamed protein product [Amoebophrya sp. A120]|eukprot:GSA120T00014205001.1
MLDPPILGAHTYAWYHMEHYGTHKTAPNSDRFSFLESQPGVSTNDNPAPATVHGDEFTAWGRISGHFGQLASSKYIQGMTAGFFVLLFITGLFGIWRKLIRPRMFNVKQVISQSRTDTQLAFRYSKAGAALYCVWILFVTFMLFTISSVIAVYVDKDGAEEGTAVLALQKMLLPCADGKDAHAGGNFYMFQCVGWGNQKPDAVNAKLQFGFVFIYTWILLTILMGFFYFADLYNALTLAEVAELVDANIIGFSEDVWELDESAYFTGQAGQTEQPQGRRNIQKAMTSRNLQPIQYVWISTELTKADTDRELQTIYDMDMAVDDEAISGPSAAGPGETGAFVRLEDDYSVQRHQRQSISGNRMSYGNAAHGGDVEVKIFHFKCLKYVYDTAQGKFVPRKERLEHLSTSQLKGQFFKNDHLSSQQDTAGTQVKLGLGKVTYDRIENLQGYFGKNVIEPHEDKTFFMCLYQEFTGSFMYVFQVLAAFLFIFLDAWYVTIIYEVIFITSGVLNAFYDYRGWNRILAMSKSLTRVRCWRNGFEFNSKAQFYEVNSEELLPGDIIEITDGMVLPCEAMLVRGSVLMDESTLTGESTPMEKEPAEDKGPKRPLDTVKDKTHMLFNGTEVIAVLTSSKPGDGGQSVPQSPDLSPVRGVTGDVVTRNSGPANEFSKHAVYAVVTAIGTGTLKGDLIRTMFYPLALFFEFDFELRTVWFYLSCLQPMVLILLLICTNPFKDDEHFEIIIGVLVTAFTSFAQLVNPLIPTMMARASDMSARRLEKSDNGGILCMEPQKIAQAGKVNLFCFDKTGTLTKEGMDFFGITIDRKGPARGSLAGDFALKKQGTRAVKGSVLMMPKIDEFSRPQNIPLAENNSDRGVTTDPSDDDARKTIGTHIAGGGPKTPKKRSTSKKASGNKNTQRGAAAEGEVAGGVFSEGEAAGYYGPEGEGISEARIPQVSGILRAPMDAEAAYADRVTGIVAVASPTGPTLSSPTSPQQSEKTTSSGHSASAVPKEELAQVVTQMRKRGSIVEGSNVAPHIKEAFAEVMFEQGDQVGFNKQLTKTGNDAALFALACCHSLSVGPDLSIVGNPLEKEALSSVGWNLTRYSIPMTGPRGEQDTRSALMVVGPDAAHQQALILRKWKFDQSRQLQVTLTCTHDVQNPDKKKVTVFAKGSMEAVTKLCSGEAMTQSPNSKKKQQAIEKRLTDLSQTYSSKGFYVLGLCQAQMDLDWSQLDSVSLDDVLTQSMFEYLGMPLFRNELRPESFLVIKELKAANVHTVMITGDSVYTGVAISKQVGLVEHCPFCISVNPEENLPVWEELDDIQGPDGKVQPKIKNNRDLDQLHHLLKANNHGTHRGVDFVSCAISADAFNKMTTEPGYATLWHKLQPYIQVYGRIKPDGKRKVIRFFQDRSSRYVIAMCGDGGNDTGALKQAQVGVALVHGGQSSAQNEDDDGSTSNVVAPFVANQDDISKTVTILKEGRACLDTYIASFYLFTVYGLTWIFCGKIYMQTKLAFGSFAQFATLDFAFALTLPLTLSFQGARNKLGTTTPNSAIAQRDSLIYLAAFWGANAVTFFILVIALTVPCREAEKPDLDVRKVEDPMPAWYSPMSLWKDGFWYIGDITGRSNNADMAMIFSFQIMAIANVCIACASGPMRPKVRKLGVNVEGVDEPQSPMPAGGNNKRHHSHAGRDLEEGRPLMFSSASSSSAISSAEEEAVINRYRSGEAPGVLSREVSLVNPQIRRGARTSAAMRGEQNVGGLLEELEDRSPEAERARYEESFWFRFFNHPYKTNMLTNVPFVCVALTAWVFVTVLLFTKDTGINYFWDVNSFAHQSGVPLKDYFSAYHGAMRTMRDLAHGEVDEITKGDGKQVLALPKSQLQQAAAKTPAGPTMQIEAGETDKERNARINEKTEEIAAENKQKERQMQAKGQGSATPTTDQHQSCQFYTQMIMDSNAKTSNVEFAQSFIPHDIGLAQVSTASPFAGYQEGTCAIHVRIKDSVLHAASGSNPQNGQNADRVEATITDSGNAVGEEQAHNFFQDLGWFGKSQPHTDSTEQKRWCEYLCMNSWPYRADRLSFTCKFSYTGDDKNCYLFQGNVDQFLHVPGMPNTQGAAQAATPAPQAASKGNHAQMQMGGSQPGQTAAFGVPLDMMVAAASSAASFLEEEALQRGIRMHADAPARPPEPAGDTEPVVAPPDFDARSPAAPGAANVQQSGNVQGGGVAKGQQAAASQTVAPPKPADESTIVRETENGDLNKLRVLDRYNVFGLEKSGYQSYSFVVFVMICMVCHSLGVVSIAKGLRT